MEAMEARPKRPQQKGGPALLATLMPPSKEDASPADREPEDATLRELVPTPSFVSVGRLAQMRSSSSLFFPPVAPNSYRRHSEPTDERNGGSLPVDREGTAQRSLHGCKTDKIAVPRPKQVCFPYDITITCKTMEQGSKKKEWPSAR